MSLLYDIQNALLDEKAPVGPALLKMRFLASRLGVPILEDWVAHEIDGYPSAMTVPEYRIAGVTYAGTFVDIVRQINDFDIPSHLIKKHASDEWNTFKIRDGLTVIDDLVAQLREGREYHINSSNLILLIGRKIFDGMSCVRLHGKVAPSAFLAVQSTVRSRALNLTLAIEKAVPSAATIVVGPISSPIPHSEVENVTEKVSHIIVHGTYNQVINTGTSGDIVIRSKAGDVTALVDGLKQAGLAENDANELAAIVKDEKPDDAKGSLGQRARAWLTDKAEKLGVSLAIEGVKLAVKGYYGG